MQRVKLPDKDQGSRARFIVGTVGTDNSNTFELPSYSLLDAAATWRRGPLRLTLSAHNLTNKEYYWTGGETADPGRPRQILLMTSVVFK